MRLLIHSNYEKACIWTANYVIKRINTFAPSPESPFVLGLPTGSSPLGVYHQIIDSCKSGKVSFSHVVSYNMDEYMGLQPTHPQSYRRFMDDNFFSGVDINMANTHVLNGMAKDPDAECVAYEQAIKDSGGVELFMGGIGNNGHIAFNEPGSSLRSRTRVITLTSDTRLVNSRFFGNDVKKVPTKALTVGIGTIMDAREVLIIVSGHAKAKALRAVVEGGVSQWCPLSCLQMHPNAVIVCDDDAAEELEYGTVRYFKDIEKAELASVGS